VRRAPIQAMKMAKPWPVLASALNDQLGWGAKWKVFELRLHMCGYFTNGAAQYFSQLLELFR
jgi:hypothetical protein